MTFDLIVDEGDFDLTTEDTESFLNFPGEAGLFLDDCFLEAIATFLEMGFGAYRLVVDDAHAQTVVTDPEIQFHPARLVVGDTVAQLAVTNPELSLGLLPMGLSLIDNGDGTGYIVGTPAPGTAGDYEITIVANNGIAPNATQKLTIKVRN